MNDLHPAVAHLLRFFDYGHLPSDLQEISAPFADLASDLASNENLDGPELTVALRKLLEAKDCAVRAALPAPAPAGELPPHREPTA